MASLRAPGGRPTRNHDRLGDDAVAAKARNLVRRFIHHVDNDVRRFHEFALEFFAEIGGVDHRRVFVDRVGEFFGGTSEGWASVAQMVRRGSFDLLAAYAEERPLPHDHGTHLEALFVLSMMGVILFAVVAVVGRSGCGKSTLVRVMVGLIPPTHGKSPPMAVMTGSSITLKVPIDDPTLMTIRSDGHRAIRKLPSTVVHDVGGPDEDAGLAVNDRLCHPADFRGDDTYWTGYPNAAVQVTHWSGDLVRRYHTAGEDELKQAEPVTVAGPVVALRHHGKTCFAHLRDQSGQIQLYARLDALGERFAAFTNLDVGVFFALDDYFAFDRLFDPFLDGRSARVSGLGLGIGRNEGRRPAE